MSTLLDFHRDIITEYIKPGSPSATVASHNLQSAPGVGDGLLILARGLGLRHVIIALMRIHARKNALVLLLNTPSREVQGLKEDVAAAAAASDDDMGISDEDREASKLIRVIDNETNAVERAELYMSGGILSVTSRILVVDMLNKVIPVHLVSGIFVNHAHRVTDTSTEAFVLRLYRDENKDGFIKAFSDYPEGWAQGIWKLERTMKILYLRRVFIWPRFHVNVSRCIDRAPPEVVEIRVQMTKRMKNIQAALMECMSACVNELKRANPSIDVEEFTTQNAMFRSFDAVIRVQLDPIWHRISLKTKQIVGDLKTLRQLLGYLASYDCVTFNSFIEALIASNAAGNASVFRGADLESPWMMMDAAQVVFGQARERVYRKSSNGSAGLVSYQGLPPGIEPVLEEQPKWRHLRNVMREIEVTRKAMASQGQATGPVLIMATGDRTCSQIREILQGADLTVVKPEVKDEDDGNTTPTSLKRSTSEDKKRKRLVDDDDEEENGGKTKPAETSASKPKMQFSSEGSEKLLKRMMNNYFRWKGSLNKMKTVFNKRRGGGGNSSSHINGESSKYTRGGRGQPASKRRRARGGGNAGTNSNDGEVVPASFEKEADDIAVYMTAIAPDDTLHEKDFDASLFGDSYGLVEPASMVVVRPYATSSSSKAGGQSANGDDDARALEEINPQWIVLYDPDVGFIRRVEVYKASKLEKHLKVYFMLYEDSTEESVYLSMIRKEKEAFEKLIHEKSIMAIPIDQDGRVQPDPDETFFRNLDTRNAGGQRISAKDSNLVVVDVREFRSSLPSLIHARRMNIRPCTLEVGDYILSPLICVERKSIMDLISSLRSGRLYTQAQSMCLHYKYPILLIEFDQHKSFSLQSASEMKSDISAVDLSSKLVLLTLAFPKLKVIWSSSPAATADIFLDLKMNQDEPSTEAAMAVGVENSDEIDSAFAITPADLLRSLPGITSKNHRHVMMNVKDVKTLSEMSHDDLQNLVGVESARKLWAFFNTDSREE
ncbi:hypothetical protein SmJEL517_g03568 [Synchytrium microbalum]|uniref:ERCC4 domain-containing protein n=1 Tax=Synchytrium microbalum TaxID=1806994 RepID=A0A507C6H7_9FUNG|nr:uncharacterized protein SmJEL517_g03568 [Synchytrium microbalum]TPX33576.1 hypothetical protein SmJEL517_g03568 [Synchytrium microbalum]